MGKFINEIGNVYGRLTVISRAGKSKSNGNVKWNCLCSCKKSTIISIEGSSLRNGNTRSCGCIKDEVNKGKLGVKHHVIYDMVRRGESIENL